MAFDDLFAESGLPVLLEQFGETVTVFPADGSAERTITAMVDKKTQTIEDGRNVLKQPRSANVTTYHDAETGFSAPGIGLSVRFSDDDSTVKWNFAEIVEEDASSIIVRFERVGYHKHQGRTA